MYKNKVKKYVCLILALLLFTSTMSACGRTKVIDDVEYQTYGFFNESEKRNPNIEYEIIPGNVIWSIILIETIIAPVYFIGFSLFQPVDKINSNVPKGAVRK